MQKHLFFLCQISKAAYKTPPNQFYTILSKSLKDITAAGKI